MDEATLAALAEGARRLGVDLEARHLAAFGRYLDLLRKWNAQINLTRVIEPAEVVARHFLDSLAAAPHLGAARTLVDVGSGPGFPGAVLALVYPDLAVTLVESIHKKAAFLEALKRELPLPNVTVASIRLEQLQGTFDVAISRATFAPPEWLARGARLVAPGGRLLAMLGRERPELPMPPGFAAPRVLPYAVEGEGDRALAIVERLPNPS